MRNHFLISLPFIYGGVYLAALNFSGLFFNLYWIIVPLTLLGLYDIFQKPHTILRNYPVLGHFRYMLESIRPEIQQYFIERYTDGAPFSREQRSIVYQRAKGELDTAPFGTQYDLYEPGVIWFEQSLKKAQISHHDFSVRVTVGNEQCRKPYSASIFNISAMSYGSLSKTAVMALNSGAKIGGFYHNTGEGGLSPYHLQPGGDLVWQIGTGYFSCRNKNGTFNAEMFKEKSQLENVKMIEIKISQGAKPGHGGVLPGSKVSQEVAQIRAVEAGKTVISPSFHSEFSTPVELLHFIARLRDLSGGKPIGFKMCVGRTEDFMAICKAMLQEKIYPDFITIDGAEGGTGAAPREFSNHIGTPLNEALSMAHNTLMGVGLRDKVRLIASGKVVHAFDLVSKLSLGADICNSARGMLFSLGCIQALRCNSNNCPAGVATQDPSLYKLLDVTSKKERVARFQKKTVEEFVDMSLGVGIEKIGIACKPFIKKRVSASEVMSFAELYPDIEKNSLINRTADATWIKKWDSSSANSF